ncbi:MAG: hypothetical protein ACXVAE_06200, partial [Candidatus Limnocylindrales bacterium]
MAVTPRHLEPRSLESALNTLEGFLAATQAIAAELDLDSVLQVIVDRARTLVDARFAALGTVDEQGGIDR